MDDTATARLTKIRATLDEGANVGSTDVEWLYTALLIAGAHIDRLLDAEDQQHQRIAELEQEFGKQQERIAELEAGLRHYANFDTWTYDTESQRVPGVEGRIPDVYVSKRGEIPGWTIARDALGEGE
jgi:chromosome segregation ATPase